VRGDAGGNIRGRWRWAEGAVVFLLPVVFSVWLGWSGFYQHRLVNWDGLAVVAHAYDVFHKQPGVHLALLGFVQPPLTGLVATLFAGLSPALFAPILLPALLGGIILGLAALLVRAVGRHVGLEGWSLLFVVALVLDPMVLSYAAGGAPTILLILLLVGAAYSLGQWGRELRFRDLLAASLFLSGAILTRYEVVLIVPAVVVYVAVRSARHGGWTQVEGTLIAFGLPLVYLAAGWIGACGIIKGDPWLFWRDTFSGPASGSLVGWIAASGWVVRLLVMCNPLLLAAAYYTLRNTQTRAQATGPLVLIGGSVAAVLCLPTLHASLSGNPWAQLTVLTATCLAAGLVLVMIAVGHLMRPTTGRCGRVGAVVLVVAVVAANFLMSNGGLDRPGGYGEVTSARIAFAGEASDEVKAAVLLRATLSTSPRTVIAGWPGFAVALFAGDVSRIVLLPEVWPPPRELKLAPDEIVVLQGNAAAGEEYRDKWQSRLPPGCSLERLWRTADWTGYEVVRRQQP